MAHSCNIVFAELAVELGAEKMTAAAEKIGINATFKFDDMETAKGNYNVSKADKNQLAWSGVGQYNDAVNPMQMAIICGAIANGGSSVNPTYIKSGTGDLMKLIGLNKGESRQMFSQSTAQKLGEVMRYTITDYYGDDLFGNLSVCAKTGTGEVGNEHKPNAWMVGYSQDQDCPLAFACVVEDSGFGFEYAGPVARAAMKAAADSLRSKG
jgi:peptidoglycan glycosyltransferase